MFLATLPYTHNVDFLFSFFPLADFQGPTHIRLAPLEHLTSLSFNCESMPTSLLQWRQSRMPPLEGWEQGRDAEGSSTSASPFPTPHHALTRLQHLSVDKVALNVLSYRQVGISKTYIGHISCLFDAYVACI